MSCCSAKNAGAGVSAGAGVIGIIGAMESEVRALQGQLEGCETSVVSGMTFYSGKLQGKDVVVVQSGIGKVNAALCAQILCIKFGVSRVINTGIAGATGKGLGVFDFVVSSATVYHDFDTTAFGYKLGQVPGMSEQFTADETMADVAVAAFNHTDFAKEHKIMKGLIASGDQFISGGDKKNFIKTNFAPLCVEMEGCAIAHACSVNKVPFIIVRCMSDMADESVKATYSFNEDVCAEASAKFVVEILKNL